MYDPAEKGTVSILSAAAKQPSVKRVVITSTVLVLSGSLDLSPKDGSNRTGRKLYKAEAYDERLGLTVSSV